MSFTEAEEDYIKEMIEFSKCEKAVWNKSFEMEGVDLESPQGKALIAEHASLVDLKRQQIIKMKEVVV